MMNLKILSFVLTVFFVPLVFSTSDSMRACIDDYPPYQYLASPPHGIYMTALTKLAQTLSKKVQFIEAPNFARCVRLLRNGDVDVIAGFNKNTDREAFAFYAPYRREENHVIISNKNNNITHYKSLQGKIIGVPRGTTYFKKFNEDTSLNKIPIKNIKIGIKLILKKESMS
jgi:polar amino acid transport system substrate-binding protein